MNREGTEAKAISPFKCKIASLSITIFILNILYELINDGYPILDQSYGMIMPF